MGFLDLDLSDLPGILSIEESLSLSSVDAKPLHDVRDLFSERKEWNYRKAEPRCNLEILHRCYPKVGSYVFCSFCRTDTGRTFSEIKEDREMVGVFADASCEIMSHAFGKNLRHGGFAMCVPPRRRHKEGFHFATEIGKRLSEEHGIPFYEDAATCRTAQRIGVEFDANNIPDEPNVIVYDDIVTTGSTLANMRRLLEEHGKTVFFVAGIYNKSYNRAYE